jgi:predicted metalloprotease
VRLPRPKRDDVRVIPSSGRGKAAGAGGLGAIVVGILALLGVFAGGGFDYENPFDRFPQAAPQGTAERAVPGAPDADSDLVDFLRFVTGDINDFWSKQFSESGSTYRPAIVNVFSHQVQTGCGTATSAVGPFYCPADEQVYLDLAFFRDLAQRFQAPGDFAQAYVVAHEIGHHVQNISGITDQVEQARASDPSAANDLSVRTELQADCLAGVWGHSTYERGLLERGDLEEGLTAAAAVGDDRIQSETTGQIRPETWTHGSSQQRSDWFKRGFDAGDPASCDTFSDAT